MRNVNSNCSKETSRAAERERPIGVLANRGENSAPMFAAASRSGRIAAGVYASVAPGSQEYDARRLRSQREVIRDVMLSAADCETWLTLAELRAVTRYGEASISAQLRHLRKAENGGYEIVKRPREGAAASRSGVTGRAECVWEYRISAAVCVEVTGEAGAQEALA